MIVFDSVTSSVLCYTIYSLNSSLFLINFTFHLLFLLSILAYYCCLCCLFFLSSVDMSSLLKIISLKVKGLRNKIEVTLSLTRGYGDGSGH